MGRLLSRRRSTAALLRENELVRVRETQAVIAAAMLNHDFALLAEQVFRAKTRHP